MQLVDIGTAIGGLTLSAVRSVKPKIDPPLDMMIELSAEPNLICHDIGGDECAKISLECARHF